MLPMTHIDTPVVLTTPWGKVPANDNTPKIIALAGAAGSGKSTAADMLIDRGFVRVKFAGPLKDMCRAIGMNEAQIEGDQKERPSAILQGKTPRQFMQLLGTEFGRDLIGPGFWVGLWAERVMAALTAGRSVVTDDCRFPNEAEAVRKMGGKIVRLVGRGGISGGHASEAQAFAADVTIDNSGPPSDLANQLAAAIGAAKLAA